MSDPTDDRVEFLFTVTATVTMPAGSTLELAYDESGRGVRLPDGRVVLPQLALDLDEGNGGLLVTDSQMGQLGIEMVEYVSAGAEESPNDDDPHDVFAAGRAMLARIREAIPGGQQTDLVYRPVVHGVDGHASCIWIDAEDNVVIANDRGEGIALTKGAMPEVLEGVLLALTGPDPKSVELTDKLRSMLYRFDGNKASSDVSVWVPGLEGRATRIYVNPIGDVWARNRNAQEVRICGFTPASVVRAALRVVTRIANPI